MHFDTAAENMLDVFFTEQNYCVRAFIFVLWSENNFKMSVDVMFHFWWYVMIQMYKLKWWKWILGMHHEKSKFLDYIMITFSKCQGNLTISYCNIFSLDHHPIADTNTLLSSATHLSCKVRIPMLNNQLGMCACLTQKKMTTVVSLSQRQLFSTLFSIYKIQYLHLLAN